MDILDEPLAIGGDLPLHQVHSFDPVPRDFTPEQAAHVLGTQGQLWTEYMPTSSDVERMAFPRLCALAEVAWTNPERKSFADFESCLVEHHLARLRAQNVNFWQAREHGGCLTSAVDNELFYVALHVDTGCVTGKAFRTREEAEACFKYGVSLRQFAAILMDQHGNELNYYGSDHRDDFSVWFKQRRQQGQ